MTIEERFENLEKQNRRLRRWMAGVGALALAAIVAGTAGWVKAADGTFRILTANHINLMDGTNRVRVSLNGASGYVTVLDYNGKQRAQLNSGGFVMAMDSNGVPRAYLYGTGKVVFHNASGQVVATYPTYPKTLPK